MAREKKTDCVILGLLAHQSLTGYEIKKWMDNALGYFWGASYGSIYPTLAKMEQEGKVTAVKTIEYGRDKVVYSITELGREQLKGWLALGTAQNEIRYETLLKLFFGNEVGAEITCSHIEQFAEGIKKDYAMLKQFEAVLEPIQDQEETHLYYLLTVRFGIKTYEAYLSWCKEAKRVLTKKAAQAGKKE